MFVDLSMPFNEKTPLFPGDQPFVETQLATIAAKGWNSKRIALTVHFGTHIDAPFHMRADGKKLSDFAPGDFIGVARVINVRGIQAIQPTDIPDCSQAPFALLWTGYSRRAADADYFSANPVLTLPAAQVLIDAGVRLVGIDSFTVDNSPYNTHKALFASNILIVENLINLHLIGTGCRLYALPLNLQDADGAPARVVAEID